VDSPAFTRFDSRAATFDLEFLGERCLMEVAELKTVIAELEARVEKIRDWL
jgi:hypothetical protein